MDFVIVVVRGVTGGLMSLFVDHWRTTFPLHVMLALAVLAGIVNSSLAPDPLTAVLMVIIVAGLVALLVSRLGPFAENRLFGYVAAVLGGAWVLGTRFAPWSTAIDVDIALGLLVVFGVLWALDKRGFEKVELLKGMRSWHEDPDAQSAAKVKDTRWLYQRQTKFGWEGELAWEGAKNSVEGVIKARSDLEAAWGERKDTCTIEPVHDPISNRNFSTKVMVRCVKNDPLKSGSTWDGEWVRDITKPLTIGYYADTQPLTFTMWENGVGGFHTLVAGASRSGKSVLQQLLALAYGPNPCVRSVFCDLKGGTAFKPLAPIGSWLVDNLGGALLLLELLNVECERRAHYAAAMGWDGGVWVPSPENPIICAYFDEIASLTGEGVHKQYRNRALYLFSEIARKGAGIGLLLRMGTQEPTKEALGTTQLVTQLEWRACFRVNQSGRGQFILPNLADQVEPARIRKAMRGTAFVDAGGEHRAMEARMHNVPTPTMRAVVQDYWFDQIDGVPRDIPGFLDSRLPEGATIDLQTHLDAISAYSSRKVWTPELALAEDPADPPETPQGPGYTLPPKDAGAPRPADRADRQGPITIRGGYAEVPGPPTHIAAGIPFMADGEVPEEGTVEYEVGCALAAVKNSPAQAEHLANALQLALDEQTEGTTRGYLQKRLGEGSDGKPVRSVNWVSARLAEFEAAGTAHRIGPKDGGATWYPGPAPDPADSRVDVAVLDDVTQDQYVLDDDEETED